MYRICLLIALVLITSAAFSQKIIPLTIKGEKYEVVALLKEGKQMWGGYEELPANSASSESNGKNNTAAIVAAVGDNKDYDHKPYAAKTCKNLNLAGKTGWYLPAREEATAIFEGVKAQLPIEERGSVWTSTERNGTQAYTLYWYTGAFYETQKVDSHWLVCLRKVE